MITVVIGKPGSGKSKMAEDIAVSYEGRRYYIATMKIMDEEGRLRVLRHQKAREGKDFITLETEVDIISTLGRMDHPDERVVLLECMANLVGNEMHREEPLSDVYHGGEAGMEDFARKVTTQVLNFGHSVRQLIVVTSEYPADEADDEDTVLYKKALSKVNLLLCDAADRVYDSGSSNITGH